MMDEGADQKRLSRAHLKIIDTAADIMEQRASVGEPVQFPVF
jgi:hypothetical protein